MSFKFHKQSGQVVIEYLLITALVVAIAATLTKTLVGRGADESKQGLIVKAWSRMLRVIGNDIPDCPKQTDFSKPNCPQ